MDVITPWMRSISLILSDLIPLAVTVISEKILGLTFPISP